MAILLDAARWPAHGTVFGHLVSDSTLAELHAFARTVGLPAQAFDHDHYDVPASRYRDLIAAGATLVGEKDLVSRLTASGLRVRSPERTPTRATALRRVQERWGSLGLPVALRDDLLARWRHEGRHYHDVRHLWQCLAALEVLGCDDPVVELAAWFHDAVYTGGVGTTGDADRAGSANDAGSGDGAGSAGGADDAGSAGSADDAGSAGSADDACGDEEASARLAERMLDELLPANRVAEVARLVRMTADHRPTDERGALLSDADLSILGQVPGRYHVYVRDVRLDYAHVDDAAWRVGRSRVLEGLLTADPLFHTAHGRELWDAQARANLADELSGLTDR